MGGKSSASLLLNSRISLCLAVLFPPDVDFVHVNYAPPGLDFGIGKAALHGYE